MNWGIAVLVLIIGILIYKHFVAPSPKFPPLKTDPDDPLLLEAMEKAKSSLSEFRELFERWPEDAFVKLRFESNTGTVEHLGAHVESINGNELRVLLVTPPVTHNGYLDRSYICTFDDLEDWQITDTPGNIFGGVTQRAMYEIARRQGVELPEELKEMEKKYVKS